VDLEYRVFDVERYAHVDATTLHRSRRDLGRRREADMLAWPFTFERVQPVSEDGVERVGRVIRLEPSGAAWA
jgi:hypothetical protein